MFAKIRALFIARFALEMLIAALPTIDVSYGALVKPGTYSTLQITLASLQFNPIIGCSFCSCLRSTLLFGFWLLHILSGGYLSLAAYASFVMLISLIPTGNSEVVTTSGFAQVFSWIAFLIKLPGFLAKPRNVVPAVAVAER